MRSVSADLPLFLFGKVDTEAQRELASAAGISSIPTLMAFRDGMLDFYQPGALPAPALEQVTSAVRELHMTGPRAEAARLGETADNQTGSTR